MNKKIQLAAKVNKQKRIKINFEALWVLFPVKPQRDLNYCCQKKKLAQKKGLWQQKKFWSCFYFSDFD